jgi:Helix-turn-helix domain
MTYTHLSEFERYQIERWLGELTSVGEIAKLLARCPSVTATAQCACGFGVKVPRGRGLASEAKNLCDTVVANFSVLEPRPLPRAFHTKARSHCTITAPLGQLGLLPTAPD